MTAEPTYVPYGSLNLRWNDDGSLQCIHGDSTECWLNPHTTITTYVLSDDLKRPEPRADS